MACEDETGRIDLVFFHADRRFVQRQLPEGSLRYVSGRIDAYNDRKQMAHPDYIVAPEARDDLPMLEPVYPLTAGLSGKVLLKAARAGAGARAGAAGMAGPGVAEGTRVAGLRTALTRLHRPAEARTSRRARRPGSGWPTTSCWPASWRWRWCG